MPLATLLQLLLVDRLFLGCGVDLIHRVPLLFEIAVII
jgi:hypothetical protein